MMSERCEVKERRKEEKQRGRTRGSRFLSINKIFVSF
jgi:hypothetical protein